MFIIKYIFQTYDYSDFFDLIQFLNKKIKKGYLLFFYPKRDDLEEIIKKFNFNIEKPIFNHFILLKNRKKHIKVFINEKDPMFKNKNLDKIIALEIIKKNEETYCFNYEYEDNLDGHIINFAKKIFIYSNKIYDKSDMIKYIKYRIKLGYLLLFSEDIDGIKYCLQDENYDKNYCFLDKKKHIKNLLKNNPQIYIGPFEKRRIVALESKLYENGYCVDIYGYDYINNVIFKLLKYMNID